jgi:hypothetical protein
MDKFGRTYVLSVEAVTGPRATQTANAATAITPADSYVEISLPYTCEFTITRRDFASVHDATFRIYNLSEDLRGKLEKDFWDFGVSRAIQFRAGYETQATLPRIFNGVLQRAYSYRDGQNWITEFTAWDGAEAMRESYYNGVVAAGMTTTEALKQISQTMPGITTPVVGNFPAKSARQQVFVGGTWDILKRMSNGRAVISDGAPIFLNDNEVINEPALLITNDTGLIGAPRRYDALLEAEMIFEPGVKMFQYTRLNSSTQPKYNLDYRVSGITHSGTISRAACGDLKTRLSLYFTSDHFLVANGLQTSVPAETLVKQ